jgi:DNA-binding response OmpR family regulator
LPIIDKALALIDVQAFDSAMLDINLNGSDSRPVAEALSARGVPIVYRPAIPITVRKTTTPAGPC